jgi:hypothetical protein
MQFNILAIAAALAATASAHYYPTASYYPTGGPTATTGYPSGTGAPTPTPTSTLPPFEGAAVPNTQVAGSALGFVVAAGFALVSCAMIRQEGSRC